MEKSETDTKRKAIYTNGMFFFSSRKWIQWFRDAMVSPYFKTQWNALGEIDAPIFRKWDFLPN